MAAFFDDLDDSSGEGDDDAVGPDASRPLTMNTLNSSEFYFEKAARKNISWYHPELKAWIRETGDNGHAKWAGWSTAPVQRTMPSLSGWKPWTSILDQSEPPFYKWFNGGMTNAAFNEVDVHVLEGHGKHLAYIEEADPAVEGDVNATITRHELFARSAAAANHLKTAYNLQQGDRVLFNMPAGIDQIIWVLACKRLGVIYCCCNPGLPAEQIADRVYTLRAKLVVTVEHPDWSAIVQKGLNYYIPVEEALRRAEKIANFDHKTYVADWNRRFTVSVQDAPFVGQSEEITRVDEVLIGCKVLVLGWMKIPNIKKHFQAENGKTETSVIDSLPTIDCSLQGAEYVAEVWKQYGAPVPVEANFPVFVIFTSGTTGKPKGVAHTHSYNAGLVETMQVVFEADPAVDRMLTVGALGWITGQSYQISAVLASRITAVIMRGNPVRPTRHRFTQVINKNQVTIFKAGSAFLREVMAEQKDMEKVKAANTKKQLRVATFCAEPVSAVVQEFAMSAICPNYINSYWATEHGGIVWSRKYNDPKQPLKADAHSWPLPWVDADTWVFNGRNESTGVWRARPAEDGEKAELVGVAPYPYMFRYVWGDVENFGKPGWVGDRDIMLSKYWRRAQLCSGEESSAGGGGGYSSEQPMQGEEAWVYVQGDFAVKYADGSYTFHGRSDEVLNVNGILFGTEHIEGAILRDKQLTPDSCVGHCCVIGYPDEVAGQLPMAWIVPGSPDQVVSNADLIRLYSLVRDVVGSVEVKFVMCEALPMTFSGKYMRRLLTAISQNEPLGDISTISNQECIPKLREAFLRFKNDPANK